VDELCSQCMRGLYYSSVSEAVLNRGSWDSFILDLRGEKDF
jgi:hypothetical protein